MAGGVTIPLFRGCMRWATNTGWFTVRADTDLVVDTAGTAFDTTLSAYRARAVQIPPPLATEMSDDDSATPPR